MKLLVLSALTALGLLFGLATFAPSAQGSIYWSTFKTTPGDPSNPTRIIGKANIDGSEKNNELVVLGQSGSFIPVANDSHLYWLQRSSPGEPVKSRLFRADTEGQNPTMILESPDGIDYRTIALSSSHLFMPAITFAPPAPPSSTLLRADLDGAGVNPNFMTGEALNTGSFQSLATDSRYIYWGIPFGPASKIGRANIDGSLPDANFITGLSFPISIAATQDKLFWVEAPEGSGANDRTKIFYADIDGSNRGSIETGTTGVTVVVADENYAYWSTNQGKIGRIRHDGTDLDPNFITGITDPPFVIGGLSVSTGSPGPGPDPDPVAKIGKVTVSGPGKVKRNRTASYTVRVQNLGEAQLNGVKVSVKGKGVKGSKAGGSIAIKQTKPVKVKVKPRKAGKVKLTFTVTAGDGVKKKSVPKTIRVRK